MAVKGKIAAAISAGALMLGSFLPVLAQTDITATVCPTLVSVTVSPGLVDYGVQDLDDTNLIPTPASVTITNNGNVTEDFLVKGANATTSGGAWTLNTTAGANQYVHRSSPDDSTFTALTTTPATLASNILGESLCDGSASDGETQTLYLNMDTPTTSSVQGEYSTTVTVTAIIAT